MPKKGYKQTEEHRNRQYWNKGKGAKNYPPQCGFQEKEKHWNWKGDNLGYKAVHAWIKKELGQPDTCQNCRKSGLVGHWIHWANISGKYKRDIIDWIRLCSGCHKAFDLKNITKYIERRYNVRQI